MEDKDKINFKVVGLVILAYLAGVINFNLGLLEMVIDMILIVFVVDTLMNKSKKKRKKPKKNKSKHCRFWKVCKLYNKKHKPCNEDEGFYGSRLASCYMKMSKLEEKNKKKKK